MTRLGGLFLGVVVCGGLFVICIVVASIFVVCARPPFLFRLARVRGAWGGVWPAGPPFCGGGRGRVFCCVWFCGAFGGCLGTKS